jgi:DNA (cytosine-5)-methyltransferase 1
VQLHSRVLCLEVEKLSRLTLNGLAFQRGADRGLRELALFAGAGGGILGGALLGWHTVCAVECDPYAAGVLLARQNDGLLPPFPVWDDVRTFDGRPWRGCVDVVSGGFPCQDISLAGKGAGIDGERSGLWREMARIVGEVRPHYVYVENSPALLARGLSRVLGDLAALGYDCRWTVLGAADVGAPHQRDRLWLVADAARLQPGRQEQRAERQRAGSGRQSQPARGNTDGTRLAQWQGERGHAREELSALERADWWQLEPDVGRVADGVAARVDRLKCLGNGQVPLCAATAWRLLTA